MAELMIHKRVRSHQEPRCTNPKCGSRRLFHVRENSHYRAFRCHECGHYVVEGDAELFAEHQTNLNQAAIRGMIVNEAGELLKRLNG